MKTKSTNIYLPQKATGYVRNRRKRWNEPVIEKYWHDCVSINRIKLETERLQRLFIDGTLDQFGLVKHIYLLNINSYVGAVSESIRMSVKNNKTLNKNTVVKLMKLLRDACATGEQLDLHRIKIICLTIRCVLNKRGIV